jgi:penicillin-binding protein 1A
VADRRTPRPEKPTGSAARKATAKPASRRKRARAHRRPSGPLGWIAAVLRFVLRVLWGLTWRGGVAVMLILAMATGYYYLQLPDVSEAYDTRSRGSVTMLDRDGKCLCLARRPVRWRDRP